MGTEISVSCKHAAACATMAACEYNIYDQFGN